MDEAHEQSFEELDARKSGANNVSGGKDSKQAGKKGKVVVPLEPPLKRSVKGDLKGAPLPPPLTSAPLAFKTTNPAVPPRQTPTSFAHAPTAPTAAPSVKTEDAPAVLALTQISPSPAALEPSGLVQPSQPGTSAAPPPSSGAASTTPFPAVPASVRIPILVGPVPAAHASSGSPPKPIVLHENTLILNPEIFSHLTPQHLQDLEALGAQKALEILQAYIVRYYKEKLRAEGGRGRGRGRPRRGRGGPPAGRGAGAVAGTSSGPGRAETNVAGPFTTAPLPPRGPKPASAQSPLPAGAEEGLVGSIAAVAEPPVDAPSPILVVDDDEDDDFPEPAAKRRRLEEPVPAPESELAVDVIS